MASQWGSNSIAPGQSAGWFFSRANRTEFLPVLQVMPLSPSFTNGEWALTSGGYPFENQLGISTTWSELSDDLQNLVYYLVVQNNSDNTIEYAFLEADLSGGENPVAASKSGLGSNSNYFLCNCSNILDLTVTIDVTEDIKGSDGFSFQVNCYSPSGVDGIQQYVITMDPQGNLYAAVDNWTYSAGHVHQLINYFPSIGSLSNATLPAGYTLTIALQNDDHGNITEAAYNVNDDSGHSVASKTIKLLQLDLYQSTNPVTSADLSPIVAVTMDFVDWANGNATTLSSGAGGVRLQRVHPDDGQQCRAVLRRAGRWDTRDVQQHLRSDAGGAEPIDDPILRFVGPGQRPDTPERRSHAQTQPGRGRPLDESGRR